MFEHGKRVYIRHKRFNSKFEHFPAKMTKLRVKIFWTYYHFTRRVFQFYWLHCSVALWCSSWNHQTCLYRTLPAKLTKLRVNLSTLQTKGTINCADCRVNWLINAQVANAKRFHIRPKWVPHSHIPTNHGVTDHCKVYASTDLEHLSFDSRTADCSQSLKLPSSSQCAGRQHSQHTYLKLLLKSWFAHGERNLPTTFCHGLL